MKAFIVLSLVALFSSCMHMGMPMAETGHQNHQGDALLEKEVISGDIKAVATVPPLAVGEQTALTLKLSRIRDQQPLTAAKVYFHAISDVAEGPDGTHRHAEGAADTDVTYDMRERSEESGSYTLSYRPSTPGVYTLVFHLESIAGEEVDPPLKIEVRRVVGDTSGHNHGSMMMHSGHSTSTYFVMGGVLMAAMMAVMLIR